MPHSCILLNVYIRLKYLTSCITVCVTELTERFLFLATVIILNVRVDDFLGSEFRGIARGRTTRGNLMLGMKFTIIADWLDLKRELR